MQETSTSQNISIINIFYKLDCVEKKYYFYINLIQLNYNYNYAHSLFGKDFFNLYIKMIRREKRRTF